MKSFDVFLSTPSVRRATNHEQSHMGQNYLFLSTPSARRATPDGPKRRSRDKDFYPRPPRGGRPPLPLFALLLFRISIHALREEGDHPVCRKHPPEHDISIHALREEGDRCQNVNSRCRRRISIHALREEGDRHFCRPSPGQREISIHALREEGDDDAPEVTPPTWIFLSTPSARRATHTDCTGCRS